MQKIYKQRRAKPYQADGKTTFNIQGRPGVYLIYEGEKIVYIGYSGSNLYKTMYRHFQSWNDRRQIRVTYKKTDNITVRVVYTKNGPQAAKHEKALIKKYTPRDNPIQYTTFEYTEADEKRYIDYDGTVIENIARREEDLPF